MPFTVFALYESLMTVPMGLKKMFGTGSESPAAGQDPFVAALHTHSHETIGAFICILFILLHLSLYRHVGCLSGIQPG